MKLDRLSELFPGGLREIVDCVGTNEKVTIEISTKTGIVVKRENVGGITFWQAVFAASWFPILVAVLSTVLWKQDQNSAVIHYATDHLAVTITGLFGAWIVAIVVVVRVFRYIRES